MYRGKELSLLGSFLTSRLLFRLVALVAVARLNFGLRRFAHVRRQRALLVVHLAELALLRPGLLAPTVHLVFPCVYQFARAGALSLFFATALFGSRFLARAFFRRHSFLHVVKSNPGSNKLILSLMLG